MLQELSILVWADLPSVIKHHIALVSSFIQIKRWCLCDLKLFVLPDLNQTNLERVYVSINYIFISTSTSRLCQRTPLEQFLMLDIWTIKDTRRTHVHAHTRILVLYASFPKRRHTRVLFASSDWAKENIFKKIWQLAFVPKTNKTSLQGLLVLCQWFRG